MQSRLKSKTPRTILADDGATQKTLKRPTFNSQIILTYDDVVNLVYQDIEHLFLECFDLKLPPTVSKPDIYKKAHDEIIRMAVEVITGEARRDPHCFKERLKYWVARLKQGNTLALKGPFSRRCTNG
ncbi:MAG: hypothetical protein GC179_30705 [Anaerolineaceae bacterium]|nr:hypothetical protein [Anaerolineaceae bacterium]